MSCVAHVTHHHFLYSVDITGDFYLGSENSVGSLSSETRLSLSTSSNKTEDARSRRQMSEMASQFEKYRLAMQKEIESLQLKNRKMENNLKTVTSEKDAAQATLLHKDQELAEMRLKNAQLQKTVSVSPTFIIHPPPKCMYYSHIHMYIVPGDPTGKEH